VFHCTLQVVNKGLCAPILSVKILAMSVKFSNKEDMEKAISLLELFPFLETLHVQVIRKLELVSSFVSVVASRQI
jgi:hypothetical protein